eukprot:c23464_g1_i1 orf=334-912(-)
MSTIYEFAKDQAGPLKPGVENVEDTFKAVVAPVYKTIESNSTELLHFVDREIGEIFKAICEKVKFINEQILSFGKMRPCQACDLLSQGPQVARSVLLEAQNSRLYEKAKSLYFKYEPLAEQWTFDILVKLMKLPFVPRIMQIVFPSILFGAGKFNLFANVLKEKHPPLGSHIPVMPLEKIEKAVKFLSKRGP